MILIHDEIGDEYVVFYTYLMAIQLLNLLDQFLRRQMNHHRHLKYRFYSHQHSIHVAVSSEHQLPFNLIAIQTPKFIYYYLIEKKKNRYSTREILLSFKSNHSVPNCLLLYLINIFLCCIFIIKP